MRQWRENEKMKRKWRENEEIHFVIFSLVPPFLSISYIKNCPILSQNVKYGIFVADVTKKLRESSATCEGLSKHDKTMVYQEGKNKCKVHIKIQIQT